MWPMSYKNLRKLASGEGFNKYFRKQFNGNEEPYLRWKEVRIYERHRRSRCYSLLTVKITHYRFARHRSLTCSNSVAEKKVRGKKKQQQKKYDPRKLEILDACFALGKACNQVGDFDDASRYYKRAKEGYEEQLGRDSEKALEVTRGLIETTGISRNEKI